MDQFFENYCNEDAINRILMEIVDEGEWANEEQEEEEDLVESPDSDLTLRPGFLTPKIQDDERVLTEIR
jgi:hypothetical protein